MSGYAVTAQFYDAVAGEQHREIDTQIAEVLAEIETRGHPVVDIGAGTGLTTKVIAGALPEAEIFAVEPDPAMRPALMARVWSDPDLRRRVSILPAPILSAPLPPVVSAAVASATLVHLSPEERSRLWSLLFARLSPGGRAVIEIQCPVARDIPESRVATAQIGRIEYEGWASARRVDALRQRWSMTYVARLDGVEIDRQSTDYVCWVASAEQVLAEAAASGLVGHEASSLVVLHKPASRGSR